MQVEIKHAHVEKILSLPSHEPTTICFTATSKPSKVFFRTSSCYHFVESIALHLCLKHIYTTQAGCDNCDDCDDDDVDEDYNDCDGCDVFNDCDGCDVDED